MGMILDVLVFVNVSTAVGMIVPVGMGFFLDDSVESPDEIGQTENNEKPCSDISTEGFDDSSLFTVMPAATPMPPMTIELPTCPRPQRNVIHAVFIKFHRRARAIMINGR